MLRIPFPLFADLRGCKKVKVCTRSKRWWTAEIVENWKILGLIKRA